MTENEKENRTDEKDYKKKSQFPHTGVFLPDLQ